MQLHNRQIKATFWKDTDLVQWPRDLRWFYEGLIQLADDSGCLEHSPFAFKLELFPSPVDSDITVDTIEGWCNQLINDGKLVPYTGGKKKCLYLLNFQKHQTLKNPQRPDVPLPDWIEWTAYESNKSTGKYIIRRDVLSDYLDNSYDVLPIEVKRSEVNLIQEKKEQDDLLQSTYQEQGEPQNSKHSSLSSNDLRLAKISRLYQQSGMGQIDETVKTFLLDWIEIYSDEWIENAFREAVLQNKRKASYVNKVLQNWHAEGGMKTTQTAAAMTKGEIKRGRNRASPEPSEYTQVDRDAFFGRRQT